MAGSPPSVAAIPSFFVLPHGRSLLMALLRRDHPELPPVVPLSHSGLLVRCLRHLKAFIPSLHSAYRVRQSPPGDFRFLGGEMASPISPTSSTRKIGRTLPSSLTIGLAEQRPMIALTSSGPPGDFSFSRRGFAEQKPLPRSTLKIGRAFLVLFWGLCPQAPGTSLA